MPDTMTVDIVYNRKSRYYLVTYRIGNVEQQTKVHQGTTPFPTIAALFTEQEKRKNERSPKR